MLPVEQADFLAKMIVQEVKQFSGLGAPQTGETQHKGLNLGPNRIGVDNQRPAPGLALYAVEGGKVGVNDHEVNVFTVQALFSTLTNVNFDPARFVPLVNRTVALREALKAKVKAAGGKVELGDEAASFKPETTLEGQVAQGGKVGLKSYPAANPDILSLKHTLLFGIKGIAAYADHAQILGQEDDAVYAFVHEALVATLKRGPPTQ